MITLLLLLLSINAIAVDFVDVEKALNDGNTAVAEQWLKQIDENSSDYNKVDFIKARLALSSNELDDAEEYLEKALKQYPHADTYNLAGGIYGMQAAEASIFSKLGYAKKSKKYLKMAHEADPTNIVFMEGLIQFNIQAPGIAGGDMDAVEPLIQKIAKLDSKKAVRLRAMFIAEDDDEEAAIAYLTKEINNDPSVLDYVYYRGYLYSGMEKYDNAIADYLKVVDDNSDEYISSSVRLNALYQLGRLASIEKKWLQKGKQCYLVVDRKIKIPN